MVGAAKRWLTTSREVDHTTVKVLLDALERAEEDLLEKMVYNARAAGKIDAAHEQEFYEAYRPIREAAKAQRIEDCGLDSVRLFFVRE